jgi:hypothetical protein
VPASIKFVGLDRLKRGVRGIDDDFTPTKRQVRVLFGALGRAVRNDVRKNITTQGNGSWDKLSKWTRARTGRRKALVTERSRIKFRIRNTRRVEIGYEERESGWNLTDHHRGFTSSGFKGKKVVIPLRNPKPLGVTDDKITILSAKPSVVPSRKVWGSLNRTVKIVRVVANRWMKQIVAKRVK